MKREGRQHGMVKTYPILSAPWSPRPQPRGPNGLNSAPTAGMFAKVPTKPTNHSKFTGKCGRSMCRECHSSPASKSKDKVKGAQRLRSPSGTMSGLRVSGFSATSVLDYLDGDDEEYSVAPIEESKYEIPHSSNEIEVKDGWTNEETSFSHVGYGWLLENGDEDWYLV